MTDYDLYIQTAAGSVAVSITALEQSAGSEAEDVAALLTDAYGEDVIER